MQTNIMLGVPKSKLKLDPRTKILMTASVSIVLLSGGVTGFDGLARILLALLPAVLLVSEGKWRHSLLYGFFFSLSSFSESVFLLQSQGSFSLIILVCSSLVTRFVPGLIAGYYLISTTTVSEFQSSMKRMHVPDAISIPFSVMFRFIPTILEESQSISSAMKMRGIKINTIFKSPVLYLEYKIVPLLMSVVKVGEELSAASITKGLGNKCKRTNICQIGFHFFDFLVLIIVFSGLILFFIP